MGTKRFFLFFVLTSLLLPAASLKAPRHEQKKIHKIVIDAGHGGQDPGATGSTSKEKDVVLSLALKLGKKIEESYSDIDVVYTRKTDVFVELFKRAKTANESQAELFISLHCNASTKNWVYGTETWVMGLQKSEENLAVAKKENASILLEDDYLSKYDGFDPNSPEASAIFSLYQNAHLEQSLNFATNIQKKFKNMLGRHDRGVKQAGFLVLYKTTMPGVLIETGFISNPDEEKYLISDAGRENIVNAIFNAFKDYWSSVNGSLPDMTVKQDTSAHVNQVNIVQSVIKPDTVLQQKPLLTVKPAEKTNIKPVEKPAEYKIVFKVQFATSSTKKSLTSSEFKGLDNTGVYFHQGLYKYTVGEEPTMEKAVELQKTMISKGYKDAFVIAFKNDERITPTEAVKLLKKD